MNPRLILAAGTALAVTAAAAGLAWNRRRDYWLTGPAIAALEPEEAAEFAPSLRKAGVS